jgi:hypothetical protein
LGALPFSGLVRRFSKPDGVDDHPYGGNRLVTPRSCTYVDEENLITSARSPVPVRHKGAAMHASLLHHHAA